MKNSTFVKNAVRNKRTTILGVLAALGATITAIYFNMDNDPKTHAEWGAVIGLWLAAFGLSQAGDGDKKPTA